MKTTLDLPDDLMRAVKVRAAREDRRLKDLVAELLREGLRRSAERPRTRRKVRLPLVHCGHPARAGEEMTPDRVAQILLDEEVDAASKPVR